MTQEQHIPPEAGEVPADSTPAQEDPSVSGLRVCEPGPEDVAAAVREADAAAASTLPSYLEMFQEYVAGQPWIGPADRPLVFHLERLCRQLDRDPLAPAAVSSAYLQAFSRLDRRRPGSTGPDPDPAQTSIFDELD